MEKNNGFQAVVGLDSLSFAARSNPDVIVSGGPAQITCEMLRFLHFLFTSKSGTKILGFPVSSGSTTSRGLP